uniref:IgGFc_binding domain-containing protein n=1 Tax=Heterorhabditis bacteriophora TaxID=37862 RepID=A0A1I7X8W9_HETBA
MLSEYLSMIRLTDSSDQGIRCGGSSRNSQISSAEGAARIQMHTFKSSSVNTTSFMGTFDRRLREQLKKINVIDKKDNYDEDLVWESWPSVNARTVEGGISDRPIKEMNNFPKISLIIWETTINTDVPTNKAILIPAYVSYSVPCLRVDDRDKGFYVWSRKTGKVLENSFVKLNNVHDTMKLDSNFCDKKLVLSEDIPAGVEVVHYSSLVMNKSRFTNKDGKEIDAVRLSGSLAGSEGRPGVIFNKQNNTITVNVGTDYIQYINYELLLSRPDGSFLITAEESLCIITASPDTNGEPNHQTLRAVNTLFFLFFSILHLQPPLLLITWKIRSGILLTKFLMPLLSTSECDGQSIVATSLSSNQVLVLRLEWMVALSCWKVKYFGIQHCSSSSRQTPSRSIP